MYVQFYTATKGTLIGTNMWKTYNSKFVSINYLLKLAVGSNFLAPRYTMTQLKKTFIQLFCFIFFTVLFFYAFFYTSFHGKEIKFAL